MKGKILGAGAISGEDGVRYYYDEKELKNLKDGQKLEGCEVDFDVKDGKAVGVYIIKGGGGFNADFSKVGASLENVNLPSFNSQHIFWDLNEAKANLLRPNIHSVKFWFLVGMLFSVITTLVSIGSKGDSESAEWWLSLISLVFILWGCLYLGKLSGSYKPFKYLLLSLALILVLAFLLLAILEDYTLYMQPKTPYVKIVFSILFALAAFFVLFLWCKSMANITNQKIILLAFVVSVLGFIFTIIDKQQTGHSFAFYLAEICQWGSLGLFVYAILKFREIRQIA